MFLSYKAGSILIGIPKWSESRIQISEQGGSVADDNVESCFEEVDHQRGGSWIFGFGRLNGY